MIIEVNTEFGARTLSASLVSNATPFQYDVDETHRFDIDIEGDLEDEEEILEEWALNMKCSLKAVFDEFKTVE